jgi:soluble lytic murein transglycosylase-like protein
VPRFRALLFAGLGIVASSLAPLCAQAASTRSDSAAAVRAYANVLQKLNPQMPAWERRDFAKHLLINAHRWKIDADILVALVSVESSWHTDARSWAGAIGLGQLMPGTAALLHVNPRDPYQNLQGAARYLGGLLQRFRNSPHRYSLAFAAYNAGPKAVEQYGGIPPFYETQNYVVKVMDAWHRISKVVHIRAVRRIAPAAVAVNPLTPDVSYWSGER